MYNGGTFSSPNHPNRYYNRLHCTWLLVSRNDSAKIKIEFDPRFDIESGEQSLGGDSEPCVHDGIIVDDIRYCGDRAPRPIIIDKNTTLAQWFFINFNREACGRVRLLYIVEFLCVLEFLLNPCS